LFGGIPTDTEHTADLRARDDDPTPRPLVRAILEAAWDLACPDFSEVRVLDVCAGSGVWVSEARRLAHRRGQVFDGTAIDIDPRKRHHLERWADRVIVGDWREAAANAFDFDLVVGNPAFSEIVSDFPGESMPEAFRPSGAVLLLHTQQAFARGRNGRRVWRACTPASAWTIPAPVSYRADGMCDSRCYQASLWISGREPDGGRVPTALLEADPPGGAGSWRWRTMPGAESAEEIRADRLRTVADDARSSK
jgi:SAM-dependent methyltransferase